MTSGFAFLDGEDPIQLFQFLRDELVDPFFAQIKSKADFFARATFEEIGSHEEPLPPYLKSFESRPYLRRSAVIEQIFE